MKVFSLLSPILFLLFIGCSSTYKTTEYFPKEELYKDFNNSAQNKELKIILNKDSSFIASDGAYILNDSMLLNSYSSKPNKHLPLMEVNKVTYVNHWKGIPLGFISGIGVGGIIGGLFISNEEGGNNPKEDHTLGIIFGAFSGAIIGGIVGYIIGWDNVYQFNP